MTDPMRPRDETRSRIVAVATALLENGGATALTTRAVAQAAGVQAPTIYRLFGDKDGLLEAVAEHVMTQYVAKKAAVVAAATATGADPLEDLRSGWITQIRFGIEHPELYVLMSDPERGRRSAAARAGRQVLTDRVTRVAAAGRLRVPVDRAVDMISAAGNGVVLTTLVGTPDDRDAGLPTAMWEAIAAQIFTPDDDLEAGPQGPLGSAVALRAAVTDLPGLRDTERALLAEWLERVIAALTTPPPR